MFLSIRHFSCTPPHKTVPLLTDLNIEIERGEHLIIAGQNGVGKTTLLRSIGLILTDWKGTIELDGISIRKIPRKELAKKIAFVQQTHEKVPSITVRDLVLTGRYPYLTPFSPISRHDEEIAGQVLALTETAEFAERNLRSLSGGERQRVWLAAALAQEPEICLLDEPSAFLDYRRQTEMNLLLDRIRTETKTTLLEVSHNLNRKAPDLRVIALADHRIVYDGKRDGVIDTEILHRIYKVNLRITEDPQNGDRFVF